MPDLTEKRAGYGAASISMFAFSISCFCILLEVTPVPEQVIALEHGDAPVALVALLERHLRNTDQGGKLLRGQQRFEEKPTGARVHGAALILKEFRVGGAQAAVVGFADDDVIDDLDAHDLAGFAQLRRRFQIGVTRGAVSGRVVVRQDDTCGVVEDGGAEELARMDEACRGSPDGDGMHGEDLHAHVDGDRQEMLLGAVSQGLQNGQGGFGCGGVGSGRIGKDGAVGECECNGHRKCLLIAVLTISQATGFVNTRIPFHCCRQF